MTDAGHAVTTVHFLSAPQRALSEPLLEHIDDDDGAETSERCEGGTVAASASAAVTDGAREPPLLEGGESSSSNPSPYTDATISQPETQRNESVDCADGAPSNGASDDTDAHSSTLEDELAAELAVHEQIALHLREIQRLRASCVPRTSTAGASHRPPSQARRSPPSVGPLLRLPSISLMRSAPRVADVLRTRRTLRSFSISQPADAHARAHGEPHSTDLSGLSDESYAPTSGDGAESYADHGPLALNAPPLHSALDQHQSQTDVLRRRRGRRSRTPHLQHPDHPLTPHAHQQQSSFSVVISEPAAAALSTTAAAAASSSPSARLVSPLPSLHIPEASSSGDDRISHLSPVLQTGGSARGRQGHVRRASADNWEHQPLSPCKRTPPPASFSHTRTPSVSERLNVRLAPTLQPPPRALVHEFGESPRALQQRRAALSRDNEGPASPHAQEPQRRHSLPSTSDDDDDDDALDKSFHSGRSSPDEQHTHSEQHGEHHSEHHSDAEHEHEHEHLIGPALPQQPERITESIFALHPQHAIDQHEDAAQPDQRGGEEAHEAGAEQLRQRNRKPSSSGVLLGSPQRSPMAAAVRLSPAASPQRSPLLRPRGSVDLSASPGASARPPRSPMQPSALALTLSPIPPAILVPAAGSAPPSASATPVPAVSDAVGAAHAAHGPPAGTGPAPGLQRASSLPLDGDALLGCNPEPGGAWGALLSATPRILARSMTAAAGLLRAAAPAQTTGTASPSALQSPDSASLSGSAWLTRRMERMDSTENPVQPQALGAQHGQPSRVTALQVWRRVASVLPPVLHVLLPAIILVQAITLPMRLAFGGAPGGILEQCRALDAPLDILFVVGVVLTDYLNPATLRVRPWLRRAGSVSAGVWLGVAMDVASTLPLDLFCARLDSWWSEPSLATEARLSALVRLLRLLRLGRLFRSLDQLETRNLVETAVSPTAFRLAKLAVVMWLVAHLAGCGYVFLSHLEGCPASNPWIVPEHIRSAPLGVAYLHAVYWGFCAMTGNGSGVETPQTPLEHTFALAVLLIGVSTYATLIGNLASIIQQLNGKQEQFRDKMVSISQLMDTHKLPPDVQHRVKACFHYLFGSGSDVGAGSASASGSGALLGHRSANAAAGDGGDDDGDDAPQSHGQGSVAWDVLQYLPSYLKSEVLCHINGEIIHSVPLFRGCSDGFMRSLVPLLRPEVVIPGDYIIRTGEIGREMYLVQRGQLEVIAHGVVVATLGDGSYVGEVAVIFEQKRTASVRALTFCDVLVLSKSDFDGVLSHYPEVQKSMRMQATMRRNARSMQDKEFRVAEITKQNERAQMQMEKAKAAAAAAAATASHTRRASNAAVKSPRPATGLGSDGRPRLSVAPVRTAPRPTVSTDGLRAPSSARSSGHSSGGHSPASASRGRSAAQLLAARGSPRERALAVTGGDARPRARSIGSDAEPPLNRSRSLDAKQTAASGDSSLRQRSHVQSSKWKKLRLLTRGQ